MMAHKEFPEGSISVTAHGKDWEEIKANARRITNMPDGKVVHTYGPPMNNLYQDYDQSTKTYKDTYNAHVTVTPATAAVPVPQGQEREFFTPEELRATLREMGYADTEKIVAKVRLSAALRDDGRYDLKELKRAVSELDSLYDALDGNRELDKIAAQVRKNRLADYHGV